jgi:hypothetical protein
MDETLAKRLASRMTVTDYGIHETYTTTFNNLEMVHQDGTIDHYFPRSNLLLQMSNIPAVRRDGNPVLMSKDEIVLCRLGIDRNTLTSASRAAMSEEDRGYLKFYESLDVLEYQARLVLLYGKCDIVTPQEALQRPEFRYIGPDLENLVNEGKTDVMFSDNQTLESLTAGRPQKTSIDLYWLRRIIRKQRPGDTLPLGQYFMKLIGYSTQTLAGKSSFITHVVFGKYPAKNAPNRNLNRKVGRLGLHGRGFLIFLRVQDIWHAIETYLSQLVPFPDGRGTMHDIWLMDHPTPNVMGDDEGLNKFLAQIVAVNAPPPSVKATNDAAGPECEPGTGNAEPQKEVNPLTKESTEMESAAANASPASNKAAADPALEPPTPEAAPTEDLPSEVIALIQETN